MSARRFLYPIITLICVVMTANNLYGVVASPHIRKLVQLDGSVISARQWGDEWLHGWETVEGYTIVKNNMGFWVYADRDATGRLFPTKIVANKSAPETLEKFLRPSGKIAQRALEKRRRGPVKVAAPTLTFNIPVILVNFNDTTTTNTPTEFESLIFDDNPAIATGPGSMKDYYEEISYGAFSVSSGSSGVSGWHAAAYGHDYYGQNDDDTGYDMHPAELAREAILAADAAGLDFSQYDNDNNGWVDVVMIVHQGVGEEESDVSTPSDIWSHSWSLWGAGVGAVDVDGVTVDNYTMQPERSGAGMITIGVFAHEFGHALGLPDLYDTDYSSEGIGYWGIMAAGSWNKTVRDGDTPAHMSAWCKYLLRFVTPAKVSGTLPNEPIEQASTAADVYQLLSGRPYSGEYFMVENRQKSGFDQGIPGDGLLIWHIDGDTIDEEDFWNRVNQRECYPCGYYYCPKDHYGVALAQADNLWELEKNENRGDSGDPYPGSSGVTSFTDVSLPNSNLYNRIQYGNQSGVSITDISASGSTMTATLMVGASTVIPDVNLKPYTPSGWDGPIVPASVKETYVVDQLCGGETTYIDWAVLNEGPSDIPKTFYVDFYVDETKEGSWCSYTFGQQSDCYMEDFEVVIPKGQHTIKIVIDTQDDVDYESDESDNEYEETFNWLDCNGNEWTSSLYENILGEDSKEKLLSLRNFRDEVLLLNQTGKKYVDLLYDHSEEIASLLLENPDLCSHSAEVIESLLPEVETLQRGREMTIDKDVESEIEALLDAFEVRASPDFRVTIRKAKREINKGSMFKQLGIGRNR